MRIEIIHCDKCGREIPNGTKIHRRYQYRKEQAPYDYGDFEYHWFQMHNYSDYCPGCAAERTARMARFIYANLERFPALELEIDDWLLHNSNDTIWIILGEEDQTKEESE